MKTLVLGGIRSGKSVVAERTVMLARSGEPITYIAAGPSVDDADWAQRISAHRARRPADWRTIETIDLAAAISELEGPAIIDCIGTWLTAQLDALQAWELERAQWEPRVDATLIALTGALTAARHDIVIVSNEVGLSLVPEHRSGRIFADWLGWTNQRIADACDVVMLVVSGQVLRVKG
ncbi:MAG: bifunctional adenosylcobinamide kinase/adenosylcobinamide-phosphate guanylyltransferase [Candidatus Nanopelagicales bacterium]